MCSGGAMGGAGPTGPPNVNLNMKIQISAQQASSQQTQQHQNEMMAGSGAAAGNLQLPNATMCFPGDFGPPIMFDDEDVLLVVF